MLTGSETVTLTIEGKDTNGKRKTISTKYPLYCGNLYRNGLEEYHLMQLKMLLKKFEKEINDISTI
jgi:hypothetical protein